LNISYTIGSTLVTLFPITGFSVETASEDGYSAYRYCEGLIKFQEGERFGFKDINGNVIVPPNFLKVTNSSDGMIGLQVDRRWGFIENPLN